MKRAPRSLQHHVLYRKYNGQDSEISALLGKCGFELRTHIEHVVILAELYTISGRTICIHRDLTLASISHLLDQDALVTGLINKFTACKERV